MSDQEPGWGWKLEARFLSMQLRWAREDMREAKENVLFFAVVALLAGVAIGWAVAHAV